MGMTRKELNEWSIKYRGGIWLFVVLLGLAILIARFIWLDLTGFEGKSLWKWLDLLIVPLTLVIAAFFLNRFEKRRQLDLEELRHRREMDVIADQQRENSLQAYLDKMTELLLNHKLLEKKGENKNPILAVGQIRTITALRTLDLSRKNYLLQFLRDSGLANFILIGAELKDADFKGADLSDINLKNANLENANLENAMLVLANLENTNFFGTNLTAANLYGSKNINQAKFVGCKLTRAFLMEADLVGIDLKMCRLNKAYLERADLRGAHLMKTDFSGAVMNGVNLADSDLSKATLQNAFLQKANLSGAKLWKADLRGAILQSANLTRASLNGANLENASLISAILDGVDLEGVNLSGAIMPDGIRHER